MTSWVYIFSKFTPEALLFEALVIFLLCCGYTAFWILRKRRYGAIDTAVPSGPVKSYLNELIVNAEQLRLQLFGLLTGADHSASSLYRLIGMAGTGQGGEGSPELSKKLTDLEARLLEQLKAIEALTQERDRLARELAEARAKGGDSSGEGAVITAGSEDSGSIVRLQQRIQDLESKLAEYNVIEDDLANLKRLQQENTSLRATLESKGIPIPEAGASVPVNWPTKAPPPAAETEAAPPPPAPEEEPSPLDAISTAPKEEAKKEEPISEEAPAAAPEGAAPAPAIENAETAEAAPPAPVASGKSENEKSEADLVAEFEKMLKG